MTITLDPMTLCGAQLEGGTVVFMAQVAPAGTLEVRVEGFNTDACVRPLCIRIGYLAGMRTGSQYLPFTHVNKVLTGEMSFRGLRMAEIGFDVVHGTRLSKSRNASTTGFSDSLWNFAHCCYDGIATTGCGSCAMA